MLPQSDQYTAAVQHPFVAFSDPALRACQVETRPNGLPKVNSGGFTATYHLHGQGGEWAVRCFTREVREVKTRYAAISRYLARSRERFFMGVALLPDGISVASGRYDIVKMEWVLGEQLDAFVRRHVHNARVLRRLAQGVLDLARRLEHLGIAHGDLQHGNIMVRPNATVCLVDYDDMWLPELAGLGHSSGLGHHNYQHPHRRSTDFGPAMDRFSVPAIVIALLALAKRPDLWDHFDGGDEKLLFTRSDYLDPRGSTLFREVAGIRGLQRGIDKFAAVCEAPYASIPTVSDFLAGRFRYGRFGASATGTTQAAPSGAVAKLLPRGATNWAFGIAACVMLLGFGHLTNGRHHVASVAPQQAPAAVQTTARRAAQRSCEEADLPPHAVWQAEPVVPVGAQNNAGGKTATVRVSLSATGRVQTASMMQSSRDPALDRAAIEAAMRSTFTAATRRCQGVPSTYALTVSFGG
jgi:TonB family protein